MQARAAQQELGLQPTGPQGQGHLHGRGSTAAQARLCGRGSLAPGQKGFKRFDSQLSGSGRGKGAHIQAEPVEGQGGTTLQMEKTGGGIEPGDLCPHEGHICEGTETAQVEATGVGGIKTRQDGRHQA